MEVKVAIRDPSIFHGKSGIVEDAEGNRVSFAGSLNETLSGWKTNWESVHVFNDRDTLLHLQSDEEDFVALWNNKATGVTSHQSPPSSTGTTSSRKAPSSTPKATCVPNQG